MAVLKCKMCGGNLDVEEGMTVCECEYCGSKQTVPSVDNEKKINLFSRANRLRANCEFDKAFGVYESIIADFPEEAEAYWGLLLCKYGIEYVDDPATGRKIPTCHRSSFNSIMEDPDFEMVMENSDETSRAIYREEAKAIEALRISINEVSSKEDPYDIFICYKETDRIGERTVDSVIAQDVYTALTEKGYKVFFSRITLEDKLGQEYEPYIFAALNSAKIMLVFGTDYEYFNAVWVRNEWSRFLSMMEKGDKKTLIPCYKDVDAYDMPAEFKRLQAQDMGKVGAMQDLIRGIEKIIPRESASSPANQVLSEKDKRRNGPDLIKNIKLVGTNDPKDFWPDDVPKTTFDRAEYSCIAVQISLMNNIDTDTLPYSISVYDNLGNQVYTFSRVRDHKPETKRFSKIWKLKKDDKYLYDVGIYRLEAWVADSKIVEYNFSIVDSSLNEQQLSPYQVQMQQNNPDVEKSRKMIERDKRRNGPDLIRMVALVGTNREDDYFPRGSYTNRVDVARFSYLAMEIILANPIGYNGIAKYGYTIYDSYGNVIIDAPREIEVYSHYDKFSLMWILRGKDGSSVGPGKYTLDTWVDDSRIYTCKFSVFDSAAPERPETVEELLAKKQKCLQELSECKGIFQAKNRRRLEKEIEEIDIKIDGLNK